MSAAPPTQPPRRRSMRQRTFVDVIMICIVDNRMIIESDHFHNFSAIFHQAFCVSLIMITMTTSYLEYHQTPVETIAACFHLRSNYIFKILVACCFQQSPALPKCTQQLRFSPVFVQPEYDFQLSCTQNLDVLVGGSGHKIRLFVDILDFAVGNYGNAFFWRGRGEGCLNCCMPELAPLRSPSSSRSSGK